MSLSRRAFTLTEVIVATSLFVVLAALVLTAVVAQAKLGVVVTNYSDMNEYSRRVLTRFDKDMRMASKVSSMKPDEVTVSVVPSVLDWTKNPPTPGAEVTVRYFYWTDGRLYRQSPAGVAGSGPDGNCSVMLESVRDFRFAYFDTDDNTAPTTGSVKKILLSGTLQRSFVGLSNTDFLVSAVVVMRSKPGARL